MWIYIFQSILNFYTIKTITVTHGLMKRKVCIRKLMVISPKKQILQCKTNKGSSDSIHPVVFDKVCGFFCWPYISIYMLTLSCIISTSALTWQQQAIKQIYSSVCVATSIKSSLPLAFITVTYMVILHHKGDVIGPQFILMHNLQLK